MPSSRSDRDIRNYLSHGARYRSVDPSRPWVPSPTVPVPDLPVGSNEVRMAKETRLLTLDWTWKTHEYDSNGSLVRFFQRFLKRLSARKIKTRLEIELLHPDELTPPPPMPIPLSEWKAWGYYAYPVVNGGHVPNASPGPQFPVDIDPEGMASLLRSPGGTHHPEYWINGLKHTALPPRPTRWVKPREMDPMPFPGECQLNPFLVHRQSAQSPITWDFSTDLFSILFNTEDEICVPLCKADISQPATWPFLTHMYINGLADDSEPKLPWPVMIRNPDGIKCEDVFAGIYDNFQQYVSRDELSSWTWARQAQARRAFHTRRNLQWHRGDLPDVWLRRIDYLGEHVMFKGLEPHPSQEGWVLYVGIDR